MMLRSMGKVDVVAFSSLYRTQENCSKEKCFERNKLSIEEVLSFKFKFRVYFSILKENLQNCSIRKW